MKKTMIALAMLIALFGLAILVPAATLWADPELVPLDDDGCCPTWPTLHLL